MLSLIVLMPLFISIYLFIFVGKTGPIFQYTFVAFFFYIALIFSGLYLYTVAYSGGAIAESIYVYRFFTWSDLGGVDIACSFLFDGVSLLMCFTVLLVSACVQQFSVYYMSTDKNVHRFFQLLSLFSFCMLLLVSAEDLVQLLFGWEAVGLCSYALINFWFTRIQANKAALKAVLVNRVGDFALMLATGLCFVDFGTTNMYDIVLSATTHAPVFYGFSGVFFTNVDLVCFLFFIAVMSKSAQFGLHTWLPDAMEGPTPVSALIHAATMVTAGVYLMVRLAGLFVLSPAVLSFACFIGALTALFGATTAVAQTDLKKTIAFSTCSQLGYMVMSCGAGHFSVAFFHLLTHAFFKALLFLCAGVIIHTLSGEQDTRRMGGLVNLLPVVYVSMCLASFALAGVPYLAGFYSKDLIIGVLWSSNDWVSAFAGFSAVVSAFLTSYYSAAVIYYVFITAPRMSVLRAVSLHTTPCFNSHLPLVVLSLFSVVSGFVLKDTLAAPDLSVFPGVFSDFVLYPSLALRAEFAPVWFKCLTILAALSGFIYFTAAYLLGGPFLAISPTRHFVRIYRFFFYRWCLDLIYNYYFITFKYHVSRLFLYFEIQQVVVDLWGIELWVRSTEYGTHMYLLPHSGGISPKNYLRLFLLSFSVYSFVWYLAALSFL